MAILKVANVHFTQSGNNRLEYSGNGILKLHSEALRLPVGTTSSTPQDEIGLIRYNSDNKAFEGSNGTHWAVFESTILGDVRSVETGIGANNFATATIAGANTAVGQGANSFTTAANTFLRNTIAGANTAVGTGANAFSLATIAGANTAVGQGANAFTTNTVSAANTFLRNTIAGANTAVGTAANTYAMVYANAVGVGANTRADTKVASVSGTSGRITVTSGNTPVVDLAVAGVGTPTTYTSGISAIAVDAYGRVTGVTDSAGYVPSNGTGATGTWNISITGSSGNATQLNGIAASSYMRTNSSQTVSARHSFTGSQSTGSLLNATASLGGLQVINDVGPGNSAYMAFHRGSFAAYLGLDTDNQFAIGGWSYGATLGYFKAASIGVGGAASGTAGEITATTRVSAPQFRNSSDTNARFEADKVVMRGGSPTMYFRDTDGNSAMLHNNGNLFYLLRGAADTETWTQVSSQWPAIFDLTNNNCTIGGSLTAISNITAYASDKRLKENIVEIPNAIEKIKQIRGVTFDWNYDEEKIGFRPQSKTNDIGCIAQEVQEVLPHVVTLAPFDTWQPDPNEKYSEEELESKKGTSKSGENYLTIQYDRMVPLLIQAIKEQQEQIESLKKEIDELKGE